jgi:lipopolysaccharide/colanic/teichoic acid biosynthesis glycosyltransferase
VFLALLGIILASPLFLIVAILIKLDSRGPVFYRQIRIGRQGIPFQMLKFRTMVEAKNWMGPPLSPRNDPRVTSLGAVLRRFKVNELPQLINVLKGDMSFVGPRPEVQEFVRLYDPDERLVLSVRPGIVGPSQIHLRNEENLYAEGVDPKQYYIENILPKKIKMDLEYVNHDSFWRDLRYLLQGVGITITGAITRRHLFENMEQIAVFFCDMCLSAFSYFLAYFLRLEGHIPSFERTILLNTLPYVIIIRMLAFTYFGLYGILIRHMSFDDVLRIVKGATISSALIILTTFLIGERWHTRSVFVIDWLILVFMLTGYRLSFKTLKDRLRSNRDEGQENVMIYGAGSLGELALRYLKMRGGSNVVGFVDDDPRKMRKNFHGVKVLGNRYDIEALARLYNVSHVLIAMRGGGCENVEHVKSLCEKASVSCEVFALAN